MPQGLLPYEYEIEDTGLGYTALAGLTTYLDLAQALGLRDTINAHLNVRKGDQGWTDEQIIMSLIMLNLAGGDCVSDIEKLESDKGFCRILRKIETHGMTRREKRQWKKRRRKQSIRTLPSASVILRYLACFHDPEQEKLREKGKAFIPTSNEHLSGLGLINRDLIAADKSLAKLGDVATLDMDATIAETLKAAALYSYKGTQSYQPLNTWWAEAGLILSTEFRDGNVPAGYQQMRVLQEALDSLPSWVKKVRLRSDTAGYQHELLKYCEEREDRHRGYGKIEFAICCDITKEFKRAALEVDETQWQDLKREVGGNQYETGQQYAEVCYVPNAICGSKSGREYRYIAIREEIKEQELPGMEKGPELFPFPVMQQNSRRYKIHGIVTNLDWDGAEIIRWNRGRCGKSEEAHSAMKGDFAGGKFPSGDFGENAAWWWIMVMSFNLNVLMKRIGLGEQWLTKRMKAIRFGLINIAGRIVEHARKVYIKISAGALNARLLVEVRRRIADFAGCCGT